MKARHQHATNPLMFPVKAKMLFLTPLVLLALVCCGDPKGGGPGDGGPDSTHSDGDVDGPDGADPCQGHGCQNGATCLPAAEGYTCTCSEGTGFYGDMCELCAQGWDEDCSACLEGFAPTENGCEQVGPCSADNHDGTCPAGAHCDEGRCLPEPGLPCLSYWEVDGQTEETPLCAALHSPEFLQERGGQGLAEQDREAVFEQVWGWVDDWYAPWSTTDVDWEEVYDRFKPRFLAASSAYEQQHLLANMYGQLDDSHTSYIYLGTHHVAVPGWGHGFGFHVTDIDGELYVYYSDIDRVDPGDRVATINGLSGEALRRLWAERLKDMESFSSPSARDAYYEMSVPALAADALFVGTPYEALLGIEIEKQDGTSLLLGPEDSGEVHYSDPTILAYYLDSSPISLRYAPYNTGHWGGNRTAYIGHGRYQDVAVVSLSNFLGEDDFERAIREVFAQYTDVRGWIIDIRTNTGGGPHQNTVASFFMDEPIEHILYRFPPDTENCGPPECPVLLEPDSELHFDQPVAVLTSGLSVSAADHFAFHMARIPSARLFGQPTTGAFGNVSMHESQDGTYMASVTWSEQSDEDGTLLQGHSVEPDELVGFTLEDIASGKDPVVDAALSWIDEAD